MQRTKHSTASRNKPTPRLLAAHAAPSCTAAAAVPSLHHRAHPQRNFSNAATSVLRNTGRSVGEHDEAVGGGLLVVVLHLRGA